jgi:hypothetical protein
MGNMRRMNFYDWIGIALILVTGFIHLSTAPDEYKDAPYLGVMFVGAFIASIIAAIGIYRKKLLWGWGMGMLVALGSIVGYILSRTVGLPISGVEAWGPAIGYLSLAVEILYVALFTRIPEFKRLIAKEK